MKIRLGETNYRSAEEALLRLIAAEEDEIEFDSETIWRESTGPDHMCILALATWASRRPRRVVSLPIRDVGSPPPALALLIRNPVVLQALRLATEVRDERGNAISDARISELRRYHNVPISPQLLLKRMGETTRRSVSIFAERSTSGFLFDAAAPQQIEIDEHWSLPRVGETLRVGAANGLSHFVASFAAIVGIRSLSAKSSLSQAIGSMLFEVFENAHLHGSCDPSEIPGTEVLRPSFFYGMSARVFELPRSELLRNPQGFELDEQAYLYQVHKLAIADVVSFCEFSVFDTGEGLVERFVGKHAHARGNAKWLPLDRQLNIVEQCFKLHETSRAGGRHLGVGLFRVLRQLRSTHAIMRIRTESVFGRTNFTEKKLESSTPGFLTREIASLGSRDSHDPVPRSSLGTLVSLLVPIV
jgi:hypothetical protein